MSETTLYFVFGLAVALLFALIVAPLLRRRDAARIRRSVEASVPMSLAEIKAGKDALRSEFAMSARKMELAAEALRDKSTAQALEIERGREEALRQSALLAETEAQVAEANEREQGLRDELRQREQQIGDLGARMAEGEKSLAAATAQLADLRKRHDEVSFAAGEKKIEAMALAEELASTNREFADVKARAASFESELASERTALEGERGTSEAHRAKLADHERTIERMGADITDRDGRLDRGERETAELQDRIAKSLAVERELHATIAQATEERLRLEVEASALWNKVEQLVAANGEAESTIRQHEADRASGQQALETHRAALADHERTIETMRADIADRDAQIDRSERDLHATSAQAAEERLRLEADAADLALRIEKLAAAHDEAQTVMRQHDTDRASGQQALEAHRATLVEYENTIERLQTDIAGRDGWLEQRAGEAVDLQERIASGLIVERDLQTALAQAAEERLRLDGEATDLAHRIEKLVTAQGEVENAVQQRDTERLRLEDELAQAISENTALKAALDARAAEPGPQPQDHAEPTAGLRQQIQDLAAQVIRLATLAEGPESTIARALALSSAQGGVVSLADRVRELQAADARKRRSSEV